MPCGQYNDYERAHQQEQERREQEMRDREKERERAEQARGEEEAKKEVDDFLRDQAKVEKPLEIG